MNFRELGTRPAFGLFAITLVGGLTTSWQTSSRVHAKPPQETVRYTVSTPNSNAATDLVILGRFSGENHDGTGTADGRTDRDSVIVNSPSPAVLMDFLDMGVDESGQRITPFVKGTIYSTDFSGSMGIHDSKNGAVFRYFFRGPGWDGSEVHYRIDGDAFIVGNGFPNGDNTYFVEVRNLRVSQDTGKRGNAYEGSLPVWVEANFYLERKP